MVYPGLHAQEEEKEGNGFPCTTKWIGLGNILVFAEPGSSDYIIPCVFCAAQSTVQRSGFSLIFSRISSPGLPRCSGPSFGGVHMRVATGFKARPLKYFWSTSETLLHPQSGLCEAFTECGAYGRCFAVCHVGGIFLSQDILDVGSLLD